MIIFSVSLVNKNILANPAPQNIHISPQLLLQIFKTSLVPRIAPPVSFCNTFFHSVSSFI